MEPRTLAEVVGVSDTTILRIWKKRGFKPHLTKQFKVSRDPKFDEKPEDIVGLFVSPPEDALVLCCMRRVRYKRLTAPSLACR